VILPFFLFSIASDINIEKYTDTIGNVYMQYPASMNGFFRCAFLNIIDCGQVLACGSNAFGQLGVAQITKYSAEPVRVEVSGMASVM